MIKQKKFHKKNFITYKSHPTILLDVKFKLVKRDLYNVT